MTWTLILRIFGMVSITFYFAPPSGAGIVFVQGAHVSWLWLSRTLLREYVIISINLLSTKYMAANTRGTQRHARIRNTGGVTTTTKYFQAHQWRSHSCELQSTLRQTLSCSMYPQGRCVPVLTRDPTSRADLELWGCDHNL